MIFELVFPLRTYCELVANEAETTRHTVSRLWIYLTCASIARLMSSDVVVPAAAIPGPDTRLIDSDSCV